MGEFVSFSVRNLAKKLGRNGTVKDEISIEQPDFLHRLPSSNWCRTRGGRREAGVIELWLCMSLWSVGIVWGQYGSGIVVLVILLMWSWVWI